MRIGITGMPGTGKTSVAEKLDREVISIKEFAKERGLGDEKDLFEVDVEAVKDELPKDCWVEGHLAHKVGVDYCIVLRTRPDILEERLKKRNYSEEKIEENLEAEKMDLILSEAFENCKIYEIDTTEKSVEETVEEIEEAVKNKESKYAICDWSSFF
ncbi:MAG: adenylate kinase family protein [Candidatus Nanohaloarchaea archaeon]